MKEGIACPKCGGTDTNVIDTRSAPIVVIRRRECSCCKFHFNTTELPMDFSEAYVHMECIMHLLKPWGDAQKEMKGAIKNATSRQRKGP